MTSDVTDQDLVNRTLAGDAAAFGTLVGRYVRPALAIAWEYVRCRDEAEDLVQEAFHRALRNLRRFDARRPFGPWFFAIVRNAARNEVDRRKRWGGEEVPDTMAAVHADPLQAAERAEIMSRIEQGLAALPPMQRSCFRLAQVEGFSSAEVADMLGINAATVRTHVHRARGVLRETLGVLRDERTDR